ncbi:MAG: alpha/beta hydrolase [Lachnospiraceae bacterium]|nr:alpha/beta hydrolase [Lachnospiraceae bacterium]
MNIEVDGYNICYKITGSGEKTVVILQGWGTDLGVYDSVANTINDAYRVVQFDFPGFGGSDEPKEAWNVDAFADFFCRFMEALEIKKAALLGHSYGGRVIIKLANRDNLPFEITNIVLLDSAGILPKRSFSQKMKIKRYKILKKFLNMKVIYALFPELIDDWRSRQGSEDYRNATPMMRKCMVMAVNEDLTPLLSGIKQDTLLIWGDKDTATPIEDAKLMEEKIPNSGLAVIKGTGHFSFLEQPVIFKNIMRSYFQIGVGNDN